MKEAIVSPALRCIGQALHRQCFLVTKRASSNALADEEVATLPPNWAESVNFDCEHSLQGDESSRQALPGANW